MQLNNFKKIISNLPTTLCESNFNDFEYLMILKNKCIKKKKCEDMTGWGGTQTQFYSQFVCVFNLNTFRMSDEEAFGGAGDAPVMAVDDCIQGLEYQLAQLTQMVQILRLMKRWQHNTTKQSNNRLLRNQSQVHETVETWETTNVMYMPFEFSQVPVEERKFVPLLAKDLTEGGLEYSISEELGYEIATPLQGGFHRQPQWTNCSVFNACSKSLQDRILASNFGVESSDVTFTLITLIKTLGAINSSVNHAVLAQQELGRGIKQGVQESVVCFLERIQETLSQAYGPALG